MSVFHETKIPLWLKFLIGFSAVSFVSISLWATASLNKSPKQAAKYRQVVVQKNFRAPAPEAKHARIATSYLEYLPVKPAAWAREPSTVAKIFKWVSTVVGAIALLLVAYGLLNVRRKGDDGHEKFIEDLYAKRFFDLKQTFMKLLGRV